jgi:MerR family redox-sensitive transcriptional activator SoxR
LETLTIGQVARRSGASVSALRYYESLGLISSIRTSGGQRRFARDALRRVAVIHAGQRVGLSLEQLHAAFAGLPTDKAPTKRDWSRVSATWRRQINSRIAEMTRIRDDLDGCIGCGCLSLQRCPLYNPHDAAAAEGPGARILRTPGPTSVSEKQDASTGQPPLGQP